LNVFVDKFSHSRFEPSGWTTNPDIPNAKSVLDYIFRWLGISFIPGYREANTPHRVESGEEHEDGVRDGEALTTPEQITDELKQLVQRHTEGSETEQPQRNGHFDQPHSAADTRSSQFARFQSDAPACDGCGAITVRNGNCYLCHNCGNSMGCS